MEQVSLSDMLGSVSIWAYILWHVGRMWRQDDGQQENATRLPILGLLLAAGGVFTFRILALQAVLDGLVDDRVPLGSWLRGVSTICAAWSYLYLLNTISRTSHEIIPRPIRGIFPALLLLPPIVVGVSAIILLLPLAEVLNYAQSYSLIIVVVDVAAVILILTALIPINLKMIQTERVHFMRVKQIATVCLCLLYLIPVYLNFERNLTIVREGVLQPPTSKTLIMGLAVICVVIQFAPFSLLRYLLLPLDYVRFFSLYRLESYVARHTASVSRSVWWVKPRDLDTATHATLISIMDNLPLLPEDTDLRARVDAILQRYADHPALAHDRR